ncbi:hypothetical protein LFL96_36920 (plasmid) [Paraburkholderia sp. D15]|uniref:hypothetical protein n=1 Tax=Paraburkholderia sp. D15 TaxID=2880218 RepID=UPI00247A87BF|nr:hypothetical protein [Paraburkholderia sp. D15]WGS55062.1 hypothetical protein LFL96_36920 [Paraburkholderia sp. D15]
MNRSRIRRLCTLVSATYGLPHDTLAYLATAKSRYPVLFRAAALRHIVRNAPLSVTLGQPFAAARRRVRRHYGI